MGSDRIVSIVPFSYSRAMTSEVSMAPTIMMMMAMIPGMMKLPAFQIFIEPDPDASFHGRP